MATRTKLHWENCSQLYIISQLVWFQQSNWVIGGGRTIKPYKLLIKLFSWACFLKKSSSCRLPLFFIMFLQTSKKEKKKWMNAHLWRQIVKWKCIISTSLTTNITSKVKLSEYTLPLVSKWSGRPQTKKTSHGGVTTQVNTYAGFQTPVFRGHSMWHLSIQFFSPTWTSVSTHP